MPLNPGQILQNRYRIVSLLGRGGMGAVYRAWDLNLNIPVALKELVPEPGIDSGTLAQLRAQFRREAQILASLIHPHLPRVIDHFEWGGNAYLVMDFIEGEDLGRRIAREGAQPESLVLAWAYQLLDALAYCHAHGVIHRDIKPQNIVIRPDGRAVLVDFGLVKLWDPSHPQTQKIVRGMGTPEYASPEHFSIVPGQHTDPRSDIYSLGATLYHALTGTPCLSAIERWQKTGILIPPRSLRRDVSPPVEAAIMRALALSPTYRFQSAREMAVALGIGGANWGTISPPQPRPIPQPVPTALPRDTHWLLEMAAAALMAIAGVLTVQVATVSALMTATLYLGQSVGASLIGAVGWFIGDLVFQALAQPDSSGPIPARRPTQRLVSTTRMLMRHLSTAQQVILLAVLLIGAVAAAALLGPLVFRIPLVWNYLPFYAIAGPLAYAATGRKRWRTLIAHVLVTTIGGAVLWASTGLIGSPSEIGNLFLGAFSGGLLMEAIAFLAERFL